MMKLWIFHKILGLLLMMTTITITTTIAEAFSTKALPVIGPTTCCHRKPPQQQRVPLFGRRSSFPPAPRMNRPWMMDQGNHGPDAEMTKQSIESNHRTTGHRSMVPPVLPIPTTTTTSATLLSFLFSIIVVTVLFVWSSPMTMTMMAAHAVSGGGLDYAGSDISGRDFSNQSYKNRDFTQVIAKQTLFRNSNLQGCRFYKA
jgi:hypothetical protein